MHLACAALLAAQVFASAPDDLLLKVGDRAPPFSMRDLDRNNFSLASYTGPRATDKRKAVLIVFFATWCKPCKKEIPIVKRIFERWKNKSVEIVYIGLSQGKKELGPFAKKESLPWRVIPDTFGLLSRRYGASSLPHILLIDANGFITFQHRGIAPDLQNTIETQLAKATGEKVPIDLGSDGPAQVDTPRFSRKMIMGRPPSGGGAAARWEPLASYLGEAAEAQIALESAKSYAAFEKALAAGTYDVANAGPLLCTEVKAQYEPLARIERQGTPTYLGIIFARRQSKLRKLTDLKGKTIGLVSPKSTSGGLYPQKALLDAGLIPGKNVKIKWLGSHTKVAEAVKAGKVDAGGCYEDCRDAVWASTRIKAIATKVLGYTEEIPAELILVKRSLDAKTKDSLRKALLGLADAGGLMQQMSQGELPITAVTPASDADLASVAAVEAFVASKSRVK